jgi:uncharacterized lipoprotein YddW (UPF0748 family)
MHGISIKKFFLFTAILVIWQGAQAMAGEASRQEVRGLWIVRTALISPKSIDQVVEQAREAGLNTLLVQVRGRGDAFYRSDIVPRSALLTHQPLDFDPLGYLLTRARSRGLQVHAWVNVLLTAHFGQTLPSEHIVALHPEWLMVPRTVARAAAKTPAGSLKAVIWRGSRDEGDVEGYYLSPAAPGVAEHLEVVVQELLSRYEVDGLHLDFIRYPGPGYDYSPVMLESFQRAKGGEAWSALSRDPQGFEAYRRDVLTSLADRLARKGRSTRKGIVVSAAVVPDQATALYHKYQDWPLWLERGIIDAVCPMTYTTERSILKLQVEEARERVRKGQMLWAGVAAYRLPIEGVIDSIRVARQAGASGVVLFSHESLAAKEFRQSLRERVFADAGPAPSPTGTGSGARREHAHLNR